MRPLLAIVSFAQKFGSAIGPYATGSLLALVGYNADLIQQTEGALRGICALCTLAPVVGCVVAVLFMLKYPIDKNAYDAIITAIADKKAGKEVDETPFKNCL